MMYVKIGGQLKRIKKFELKYSSTTNFFRIEDEERNVEVYKCPQTSTNYKHIRRLFATDIFFPRRVRAWERRTHYLNASTGNINLAVTHNHATQQNVFQLQLNFN